MAGVSGGFFARFRRLVRPVAAALLLTGCFQYVPASSTPPPQTEVRVTLSRALDIQMGEFTLSEVNRVEGVVADTSGQNLALVARWLYPRAGRKYDAQYGSYDFPLSDVQKLEVWQFSPKRTAILGVVVAGGVATLLRFVWRVASGNTQDQPRVEPS
ncbi:MAG: hypothetical protein KatS3mg081_0770 [Gemmatimonadales bacterium]|nr:MAG: hypothetical protein KatS3mg081_0770 [Gemmatimonadales bacterium]